MLHLHGFQPDQRLTGHDGLADARPPPAPPCRASAPPAHRPGAAPDGSVKRGTRRSSTEPCGPSTTTRSAYRPTVHRRCTPSRSSTTWSAVASTRATPRAFRRPPGRRGRTGTHHRLLLAHGVGAAAVADRDVAETARHAGEQRAALVDGVGQGRDQGADGRVQAGAGGQRSRRVGGVEAGVGGAGQELRVQQARHQQVAVGGHAVHPGAAQGGGELPGRGLAGGRVRDDLGEHRVVVGADDAAVLDAGVEPDAVQRRCARIGRSRRGCRR